MGGTLAARARLVAVAHGATREHSDAGQWGHSCPAWLVHAAAAALAEPWLCLNAGALNASCDTQCD